MNRIITIFALVLIFGSCKKEDLPPRESNFVPVLMGRSGLDNALRFEEPRAMVQPGKIYVHGNYLLVNEYLKGIHVIDNADMINPQSIGFINIPGNIDIAMKDNLLYADQAVDLIALELGVNTVKLIKREMNVFPELPAPDRMPYRFEVAKPDSLVIVNWRQK